MHLGNVDFVENLFQSVQTGTNRMDIKCGANVYLANISGPLFQLSYVGYLLFSSNHFYLKSSDDFDG